jgi:hypothetical protein
MLLIHLILVVYTTVSDLHWKFLKTSLSVLNLLSPVMDYEIYFIVVFLIIILTVGMCVLTNHQKSNNVYRAQ